jgi:hypothetical protein
MRTHTRNPPRFESEPIRLTSGVAARSLAAQAIPFQQYGSRLADRKPAHIELAGSPHPIVLRYRTQRLLLARIYQLQVTTTAAGDTGPAMPYAMELSTRGKDRSPYWICRDGSAVATGPTGAAVEALARTVDHVSCTATWCPTSGRWHFCIEPYAGSHLRVYFPPITYTTTLRAWEAEVISAALAELSTALTGRTEEPTTDLRSAGGKV